LDQEIQELKEDPREKEALFKAYYLKARTLCHKDRFLEAIDYHKECEKMFEKSHPKYPEFEANCQDLMGLLQSS